MAKKIGRMILCVPTKTKSPLRKERDRDGNPKTESMAVTYRPLFAKREIAWEAGFSS
jgi:hypothetical protein